jgi:hypothetical protein
MSNVRNIMQGIIMYTNESKGMMPPSNWGGNPPRTPGWLYDNSMWEAWTGGRADPDWSYLESGAVYKYVNSRQVFKCPLHLDRVSSGATEKFTSYLMNGTATDFGGKPYKITKFHVMDVIIWETGESDLFGRLTGKPPFNDGCSDPREWITDRHGGKGRNMATGKPNGNSGASVGCIDGHVEWMSYSDYQVELDKPVVRRGKSRLWISPSLPNGGWF